MIDFACVYTAQVSLFIHVLPYMNQVRTCIVSLNMKEQCVLGTKKEMGGVR